MRRVNLNPCMVFQCPDCQVVVPVALVPGTLTNPVLVKNTREERACGFLSGIPDTEEDLDGKTRSTYASLYKTIAIAPYKVSCPVCNQKFLTDILGEEVEPVQLVDRVDEEDKDDDEFGLFQDPTNE